MPGKLNALAIDALSLFSLFCSPKLKKDVTNLDICDFGDRKIVSKEQIQAIEGPCGQFFNHRMTFLPELKTPKDVILPTRDNVKTGSKNYIELYNYYSVLEVDGVGNGRLSNFFMPPSSTLTVKCDDIYH
ncbi:hypothetical protein INT46_009179 [Mucor plumbeus]|uniref:Uncharacterized protein n=1 Tax=Mucor plumbeus TaxID=97098 RepID=A0A8H7RCE0_9FUNG|nr:hypothetical protein INT46_009179 [Mucor plumbeus]